MRLVASTMTLLIWSLPHFASASDASGGAACPLRNVPVTKAASCRFNFRGFPLIVRGDTANAGTSTVHVWATIEEVDSVDPAHSPTLVQCSDSEAKFASCEQGFPDDTTLIGDNTALEQFHVICHMQSTGTGTYFCESASGR